MHVKVTESSHANGGLRVVGLGHEEISVIVYGTFR
jgi:hypothetical protein